MSKTPYLDVITADPTPSAYYRDLWSYRELFLFTFWRDILVRYKQTFFGVLWALFRPLLNIAAFAFVFGKFAGLPADGNIPYALFVLGGVLPWQWFAGSLNDASTSLIVQSSLLTKVYFPRAYLPLSLVLVNGVDFAIGFALLLPILWLYGLSKTLLALPLFVTLLLVLASGVSLLFSAITVHYRDSKIIIPFILQMGIFLSPVGYSSSLLSAPWSLLYPLNPLVGIIDGFRYALFGIISPLFVWNVLLSVTVTTALFIWGQKTFRTMEKGFADVV